MARRGAWILGLHAALACATSLLATATAACGSSEPRRTRTTDRPAPSPAPRPRLGRWELADEIPSFRRVARVRSQHLGGGMEGQILANPLAEAYPALGPSASLPPGAALTEMHYPQGSAEPSVLFAMVKRQPGFDPPAGDWEYFVMNQAGELEARGRLAICGRCHAEAPHDAVFGPPRPSTEIPAGGTR